MSHAPEHISHLGEQDTLEHTAHTRALTVESHRLHLPVAHIQVAGGWLIGKQNDVYLGWPTPVD